jgi:hypothetical protein
MFFYSGFIPRLTNTYVYCYEIGFIKLACCIFNSLRVEVVFRYAKRALTLKTLRSCLKTQKLLFVIEDDQQYSLARENVVAQKREGSGGGKVVRFFYHEKKPRITSDICEQ